MTLPVTWQSPFSAYKKLQTPRSFLLESASGPVQTARYSMIGLNPHTTFTAKGSKIMIADESGCRRLVGDPFRVLRETVERLSGKARNQFAGAAVGFFSYDAGRFIERIPDRADDDLSLPDAVFYFCSLFVVFDHADQTAEIVAMVDDDGDPAAAYRVARALIDETTEKLEVPDPPLRLGEHGGAVEWGSNMSRAEFCEIVSRAKEYIAAGDIYQVNLSQRLSAAVQVSPLAIYSVLRDLNPAPFSGFFDFGDWQMVSSSPERLVKLEKGEVQTRPIAGTIKRGSSNLEDIELKLKMTADVKERAEHIMLVDLERNDIGRVCDYGSVRADQLLVTETYSHVSHIVSNIKGRLNRSSDGFDLLRACFPGGTITGCPKVRAMEIIEELEPVRRGPYTGSMGYLGFNGDLDFNIIIRTLIIKNGIAHVQAGAGIVADSDPNREYEETLHKAEALVRATTMAQERHGCSPM